MGLRVHRLIDQYALHAGYPTSLRNLYDQYEVQLAPLSPRTMGCSVVDGDTRLIILSSRLSLGERRATFCHEVAHDTLNHANGLHLLRLNAWVYSRAEAQAREAAARMLISRQWLAELAAEGRDVDEMAAILLVPPELVRLRAKIGQVFPNWPDLTLPEPVLAS
jgi:hypothetical protein